MATTPPQSERDNMSAAPTAQNDGQDSDDTHPMREDDDAGMDDSPRRDHDENDDDEDDDDENEDRTSSPNRKNGPLIGTDDEATPLYTATTTTTRRNANGSVSSVYSGNKIRHLKKPDGIPLWRKDIQYDFLRMVFTDELKVFHKVSDGSGNNSFADVYLDAMAKSSKCSKILKEKLLTERPAAINMAMVCLLVNVGRMNTTLNFFPEMRAQLRTYHAIPSLQQADVSSYKQLQDAPRLKSILKGATEDTEQPGTIEDIMAASVPRTNPVNLIFVLAQSAPKISGIHFDVPRDFFDLVMKENLSSKSRANAFLWLMWWYLESDFSLEAALNNPYGPGRYPKENAGKEDRPLRCPPFVVLTEEEAAKENVDTQDELDFGEMKRQEREAINNGQMPAVYSGPKRSKKSTANEPGLGAPLPGQQRVWRNKPPLKAAPRAHGSLDFQSDSDRTISPPPKGGVKISNLLNEEGKPVVTPTKGPGRGNWRKPRDMESSVPRSGEAAKDIDGVAGTSMFNAYGNAADTPSASGPAGKRRGPTNSQRTAESNRKAQVDTLLDDGLDKIRRSADRRRTRLSTTTRVLLRMKSLPSGYDSDDEAQRISIGRLDVARDGIAMGGFGQADGEANEYGASAWALAKSLNKLRRKLRRKWDGDDGVGPIRKRVRRTRDMDLRDVDMDDVMDGVEGGDEGENGGYEGDESRLMLRADDEWSDGDD